MNKQFHEKLARLGATHILGIDESGTGAWAGSFFLGAVFGPKNWKMDGVRDSKKTKAPEREQLVIKMDADLDIFHGTGIATVDDITKYMHSGAYGRAFLEAVTWATAYTTVPKKNIAVVMDGSRNRYLQSILNSLGFFNIVFEVKADVDVPHVSAASIFAKYNRDLEMNLLDKKFPKYYFTNSAGYGTKEHRAAIAQFGRIPGVHRILKTKS